jgi:hypothetical protein
VAPRSAEFAAEKPQDPKVHALWGQQWTRLARRIAEGKSARDATRLLKRYLARRLYRLLQSQELLMA